MLHAKMFVLEAAWQRPLGVREMPLDNIRKCALDNIRRASTDS